MVKGGARHTSKPSIDAGLLLKALKENIGNVLEMGHYETASRTGGCIPKGLVENAGLLEALVKLAPTAEIHTQPLKSALLKLLTDEPTLNKSKFNGSVWISLRMERVTTVLYHLRRLANDGEAHKFCATRLTGSEFQVLKRLVEMVEVKDSVVVARATKNTNEDHQEWEMQAVAYEEDGSPAKKRTLKKEISDVSVDSQGFPRMIESPAEVPKVWTPPKRLGAKLSEKDWQQSQDQKSLRCSLGLSTDASLSTSSSSNKRPLEKGTPMSSSAPLLTPWLKLSKTNASKPERSYILGSKIKGEKMKLVIEVPKTWSSQYSFVVDKIMQKLRDEHLSKEQARELRNELCKKYP